MPGRVVGGVGVGARATASALIEQDNTIVCGVEEDGARFGAISTRTAVEKYYW